MTASLPDLPGTALERCAAGRLRDAYPVGEHDVEVRVLDESLEPDRLTALLTAVVEAVQAADPACRKVVFAAAEGDLGRVASAEQAGFRYVVDVDLPGTSLSLLVAEPAWVTRIDDDTDAITARSPNP
ncbi:hypothetical protein [Dactylosporangium sp. NPDC048998]|uniref:hypothetical protein n=1 Tax=Dactylosporangium sp. NPDC048998 TaxID=3363976 RepID=UPI00371F06D1